MLQKKPEKGKPNTELLTYNLCTMWLTPLFAMLALGYVPGYHWSYWHVFFAWNAVEAVFVRSFRWRALQFHPRGRWYAEKAAERDASDF